MKSSDINISARDARLLLMHAQGLLGDPDASATPGKVLRLIHDIGFVQLDSIPVVERAQHLTLRTRLEHYRPETLKVLVEKRRALFEHWTHDASVLPVDWLPHWRHRSARFLDSSGAKQWIDNRLGDNPKKVLRETLGRIEKEGPLRSRDFDPPVKGRDSGWWKWKPHKAALEYLWWAGDLCVSAREGFQKVYDLTERTHREHHAMKTPSLSSTVDTVCAQSMDRQGCASAAELANFYDLVTLAEARRWCKDGVEKGSLVAVTVESEDPADDTFKPAFAPTDILVRIQKAQRAFARRDRRLRLLAPFDPIIRDRKRALRLFHFDYRFEAYTPPAKRKYGYYVFPVLQGDRLIGRCDLKMHRDRKLLEVKGAWWEPGVRPTKKLKAELCDSLEKLAEFAGASRGIQFTAK